MPQSCDYGIKRLICGGRYFATDFLIGRQYGKGMSAYTLKTIAIVAMVVDHTAWAFVPTVSALGQIMHTIGRLTAPIMCYFVAEGYHNTRNLTRYALRLGAFALISHFPSRFFESGRWSAFAGGNRLYPTSFMYTLFVGLISLIVWKNDRLSPTVKGFFILSLCVAAIPGEGMFLTVLWILAFGAYRGDFKKQARSFIITAVIATVLSRGFGNLYQLGMLLAVPLLRQYNGTLGGSKHSKWFFYAFYPLHLLVIGFLKYGG